MALVMSMNNEFGTPWPNLRPCFGSGLQLSLLKSLLDVGSPGLLTEANDNLR